MVKSQRAEMQGQIRKRQAQNQPQAQKQKPRSYWAYWFAHPQGPSPSAIYTRAPRNSFAKSNEQFFP